jgi:hypothetical protein
MLVIFTITIIIMQGAQLTTEVALDHSHAVLREGARLVRADGGGAALHVPKQWGGVRTSE